MKWQLLLLIVWYKEIECVRLVFLLLINWSLSNLIWYWSSQAGHHNVTFEWDLFNHRNDCCFTDSVNTCTHALCVVRILLAYFSEFSAELNELWFTVESVQAGQWELLTHFSPGSYGSGISLCSSNFQVLLTWNGWFSKRSIFSAFMHGF